MKTVIFDFDGTLADSFDLVVDIAYSLTGMAPLNEDQVALLRRMSLMKARKMLGIPLARIPRLLLLGRKAMQQRIDEVHPFPGTEKMLAELRSKGYHLLVISSNSEQNVRRFLRNHNLESYFDGVYGGVGVFDKAGALRGTMKRNRLDRNDCYYVGDEVRDAVAAKKVGVCAISVSWGYQAREALEEIEPFAIADKRQELPEIIALPRE